MPPIVNIASIIREHLLRNDQLIIPGFGTFRSVHQPARLNESTRLLIPPSKNIIFESQQKSGDSRFMLSVRKKLGLSESEADETVQNFLKDLEKNIRIAGKAVIEGVGEFIPDRNGRLKFKASEDLLNLSGVFALPEIEIPAPAKVEKAYIPPPRPQELPAPVIRPRKRWRVPVTLLVVLTGLAILAYFTGIFDPFPGIHGSGEKVKSEGKKADRMVFGSREVTGTDSLQGDVNRQLEERTARENALRFEENKQETKVESLPVSTPNPPVSHAGPYHIISGAFMEVANAEKKKGMLREKGLAPEILPRRGKYHMVSLGSYATKEEAAEAIRNLHEKLDQELWVMKIK